MSYFISSNLSGEVGGRSLSPECQEGQECGVEALGARETTPRALCVLLDTQGETSSSGREIRDESAV